MQFENGCSTFELLLEPWSLLVLTGDLRTKLPHCIDTRQHDDTPAGAKSRGDGFSVTLQNVKLLVASLTQAGKMRDPQRSISTAERAAILQRFGVPKFVARTLSQPRCKPPPPALSRCTLAMGASKRQRLTAPSACEAAECKLRAGQIANPTPLTSCNPPPPSFTEMNTPSSPARRHRPSASSCLDQASPTPSSPALPQLLPLPPKTAPRQSKGHRRSKILLPCKSHFTPEATTSKKNTQTPSCFTS